MELTRNYKYIGNFSATPPEHSRQIGCDKCMVEWTACWDSFMCPECGEGELLTYGSLKQTIEELVTFIKDLENETKGNSET